MTSNARRIILKLVRMQNALDFEVARIFEAYEYDRGFDAGEFCGAHIERDIEKEEQAQARRFGFSNYDAAMTSAQFLRCLTRSPLAMASPLDPMPLPR
jgi:hypothetical protein